MNQETLPRLFRNPLTSPEYVLGHRGRHALSKTFLKRLGRSVVPSDQFEGRIREWEKTEKEPYAELEDKAYAFTDFWSEELRKKGLDLRQGMTATAKLANRANVEITGRTFDIQPSDDDQDGATSGSDWSFVVTSSSGVRTQINLGTETLYPGETYSGGDFVTEETPSVPLLSFQAPGADFQHLVIDYQLAERLQAYKTVGMLLEGIQASQQQGDVELSLPQAG